MMGLPTNDRPDCFWQADLDEAAGHLVEVIREVRPQVLVTYDEYGGYGHPDHIQAHRVAMRGVELAADPATGRRSASRGRSPRSTGARCPRSGCATGIRALREAGDTTTFEGMDPDGEMPSFVRARRAGDHRRSTRIDLVEAKMAAMRAHATQITVDGPFFALSNNLGNRRLGHRVLPAGPRGRRHRA